MTFNLALTNPAEYARISTDLATNGVSMLAGGVMIAPTTDAFAQDNSNRSVSERLFQSALMNYGQGGTYQNNSRKNPGTDTGGLDLDQQVSVLQALHGKSFKSIPNITTGSVFTVPISSDDNSAPSITKRELDRRGGPVYARLRWDGGGHAV
jgi:hypothetical protein